MEIVANRYQIHTLLGQGGAGSTYQAEDLQTHRWVALKVMSLKQLGNWDLLKRFEREAEALGKIAHPGVPAYIEHFQVETEDDCCFYLVQEFAAGKSLDQWVADGWRASEAEVKRIAAEVLGILNYLHQLNPPMIHRDIKPQNIIRQPDGRIYLVDFGAVQSAYRDALQQQGTFVGTMGYMPPEQLRGKAVFASDLYGLGATLVYLLTHRNPDELPMERMRIAFRGRVQLSEGFAVWLEKLLEPMVRERWGEAAIALQQLKTTDVQKIERQNLGQIIYKGQGSRTITTSRGYQIKIDHDKNGLDIHINPSEEFKSGIGKIAAVAAWLGTMFVLFQISFAEVSAANVWFWIIYGMAIALASACLGLCATALLIPHWFGVNNLSINRKTAQASLELFGMILPRSDSSSGVLKYALLTDDIRARALDFLPADQAKLQGKRHHSEVTGQEQLYLHFFLKNPIKFGLGLEPIEKYWIAQEINGFLERLGESSKEL